MVSQDGNRQVEPFVVFGCPDVVVSDLGEAARLLQFPRAVIAVVDQDGISPEILLVVALGGGEIELPKGAGGRLQFHRKLKIANSESGSDRGIVFGQMKLVLLKLYLFDSIELLEVALVDGCRHSRFRTFVACKKVNNQCQYQ